MRILILGVNGFTGRHLVKQLNERDEACYIYGADINECLIVEGKVEQYYKLDITNFNNLLQVVDHINPDKIFNLVGVFSGSESKLISINLLGVINLLDVLVKLDKINVPVLFVGSAAEYGISSVSASILKEESHCDPESIYGVSKFAATKIIKSYVSKYNIKAVIARPFNIIGPGVPESLLVGSLLMRIESCLLSDSSNSIKVGNITTYRDFIDVVDVADAYIELLNVELWGQVFNICSGFPIQIKSVVDLLFSFSKKKIFYHTDSSLIKENDVEIAYGDNEKLFKYTGFKPKIGIEESLLKAWNYHFKISQ